MARTQVIDGRRVPLTAEEETTRDTQEAGEAEEAGDRKRREAELYMMRVTRGAFDTSLNGAWAVRLDDSNRQWMDSIASISYTRSVLGAQTPWPADVELEAVHKTTGQSITQAVTQLQFATIMNERGIHERQARTAFAAIIDRINALGTDYAAIDAIDVITYPGTVGADWPTFVED